jgi:hypothetical protein
MSAITVNVVTALNFSAFAEFATKTKAEAEARTTNKGNLNIMSIAYLNQNF